MFISKLLKWRQKHGFSLTSTRKTNIQLLFELSVSVFQLQFLLSNAQFTITFSVGNKRVFQFLYWFFQVGLYFWHTWDVLFCYEFPSIPLGACHPSCRSIHSNPPCWKKIEMILPLFSMSEQKRQMWNLQIRQLFFASQFLFNHNTTRFQITQLDFNFLLFSLNLCGNSQSDDANGNNFKWFRINTRKQRLKKWLITVSIPLGALLYNVHVISFARDFRLTSSFHLQMGNFIFKFSFQNSIILYDFIWCANNLVKYEPSERW